jgi:hypothetical protein
MCTCDAAKATNQDPTSENSKKGGGENGGGVFHDRWVVLLVKKVPNLGTFLR